MTPLVLAAVMLLALLAGVFAMWLWQQGERTPTQSDPTEDWLRAARSAVHDGQGLSSRIANSGDRSPPDLSDGVVETILSDIKRFNARIAAVSATAPTAMDTRVCREVGVRAHAVYNVYERELGVREALGTERRATLAGDTSNDPRRCLEEFDVALRDLEVHVELL